MDAEDPRAIGVDLGLSVTDAVAIDAAGGVLRHVAVPTRRLVPAEALRAALEALAWGSTGDVAVAVTGGRSAAWSDDEAAAALRSVWPAARHGPLLVPEAEAIGRGGLRLADREAALVVSCGTGTAMVAARSAAGEHRHASGTPVGGGTLRALGALLLGSDDAEAIADLAEAGDAGAVDTTLADVLGTGLGTLPASATAVSLGRLSQLGADAPRREDLAAGLVTMVAQTIALIALSTMRAADLPVSVAVGRLAGLEPLRAMLAAVFEVYGVRPALLVPEGGATATALGAALASLERTGAVGTDPDRATRPTMGHGHSRGS